VVGLCQFGHGSEAVLDHLQGGDAGVACYVIGATEDEDGSGVEVDHILPEADDHLWRCLTADASINVGGLVGEEG